MARAIDINIFGFIIKDINHFQFNVRFLRKNKLVQTESDLCKNIESLVVAKKAALGQNSFVWNIIIIMIACTIVSWMEAIVLGLAMSKIISLLSP